jgi:aspartate/methionine/tyrosine aminotransferase
MTPAYKLNKILSAEYPAATRLLTDFGKRLYFPKGVPAQAADAKNCVFNATIGQLKDDDGQPLPLPIMAEKLNGLPTSEVFLYTPQGGRQDLRTSWRERILSHLPFSLPLSLPVVCCGLTHGLSICADLFIDEDTDVILPTPRWGNYDLVFGIRRQGRIHNYTTMSGHPQDPRSWSFNLKGLQHTLSQISGKGFLVLNTPSNPGGYTPTEAEVDALVHMLEQHPHPLCILLDEAYLGMEWEQTSYQYSLFAKLHHLDKSRFILLKIDGATKELFFFGGRIAFVSSNIEGNAAKALEEKFISCIRSTVSALPSPSQALVQAALIDPTLEQQIQDIRGVLRRRYQVLKKELQHSELLYWPFNSAFFALIHTPEDPEEARLRLLKEGVGLVSFPSAHALRLSYSTVAESDIPKIVSIVEKVLRKGTVN